MQNEKLNKRPLGLTQVHLSTYCKLHVWLFSNANPRLFSIYFIPGTNVQYKQKTEVDSYNSHLRTTVATVRHIKPLSLYTRRERIPGEQRYNSTLS
jgi:hypothetical protein